jgi:hypothetical protein
MRRCILIFYFFIFSWSSYSQNFSDNKYLAKYFKTLKKNVGVVDNFFWFDSTGTQNLIRKINFTEEMSLLYGFFQNDSIVQKSNFKVTNTNCSSQMNETFSNILLQLNVISEIDKFKIFTSDNCISYKENFLLEYKYFDKFVVFYFENQNKKYKKTIKQIKEKCVKRKILLVVISLDPLWLYAK